MLARGWVALILIIENALPINHLHEYDHFVTGPACRGPHGAAAAAIEFAARRHHG
jgi:hypothetical protein